MREDIIKQSHIDFSDDFEELLYLFSSSLHELQKFQKDIKKQKQHILSFEEILKITKRYELKYQKIISDIKKIILYISISSKENILVVLSHKKDLYTDLYRSLQNHIAGILSSTDFQSPSFNYSKFSLAGIQTNKIEEHTTDYKRDRHLDAQTYEKLFRNEYIEGIFTFPIHIYLTSSGMSAFTTALQFFIMDSTTPIKTMIGRSSYFENKEIIKKTLKKDVFEFDEQDIHSFSKTFNKINPTLIVFDSFCNASTMAFPDTREILHYITKHAKENITIILDNTNLSYLFQPLTYVRGRNKNVRIIVIESLNKYYEFGTDRTTGGVIAAWGKNTVYLNSTREHIGTNISDIACHLLPKPNKKLLKKRLYRFERNVHELITSISLEISLSPSCPIKKIIHPSLSDHPAYNYAKDEKFHGSFFTFSWHKKYDTVFYYKKFIKEVLNAAKKQNIQLIEGTSFGMNNSRIYLTSARSDFGKPFVRFSVGTENRYEIEKIKTVLIQAIKKI